MTEQPRPVRVGAPDVGLYLDDDRAVAAEIDPVAPRPLETTDAPIDSPEQDPPEPGPDPAGRDASDSGRTPKDRSTGANP
ncbi:hypothetical protein [Rhodococcus sp. AW25M09]|uniref:hypothetical protein n=1 Tax=Rhodococcus sp. AW25M09 TaxID=1268303 RepID=UPI0005B334BE|nr:hypothetical protein [Rhodococcus sp. AW25M09]